MRSKPRPPHRILSAKRFDGRIDDRNVFLTQLSNQHGAQVSICNYGARVVQILMPNHVGQLNDVALGYDDLPSLQRPAPHGVPSMGAFIGRYANRIANARFTLDGQTYELSANSGEHCIHGGSAGSRYAVFTAERTAPNAMVLRHRFFHAKDGFPGALDLTLHYALSDDNALHVRWEATALDAPTVANFTSHVFFNLAGTPCSIENHRLHLPSKQFLQLNPAHIPSGELASVMGTPFDFRTARRLGDALAQTHPQLTLCNGFDHPYAVDNWDASLRHVATLNEPESGRSLRVLSTEPGLQLFTANGLSQADCGFAPHSGVCLEPSYYPDSPNQPQFPSTRIAAGQVRRGEIVYAFSV